MPVLSSIAIALQGLGFNPLLCAMQGLLPVATPLPPDPLPVVALGAFPAPSVRSVRAYRKRRVAGKWTHIAGEDWFEKWLQKVKQAAPVLPVQVARLAEVVQRTQVAQVVQPVRPVRALRSRAQREKELLLIQ